MQITQGTENPMPSFLQEVPV